MTEPRCDSELEALLARHFAEEALAAREEADAAFERARAATERRARRPPRGHLLRRSAQAIAAGVAVLLLVVLLLPREAGPRSGDGTTGGATGSGTPPAADSSAQAERDPTQLSLDEDGVPVALDGEPVLRGRDIVARAGSGDPAPFLVAGWATFDPQGTCAPSTVHCNFTSLVDGPNDHSWGVITLDAPNGDQFGFGRGTEWAGGFHVLRVRAACEYGSSTCLVVDAELPPPQAAPAASSGYDADGIPRTVDGQRVHRGAEIRDQVAAGTLPVLYVAGWVTPTAPFDPAACEEPGSWEMGICDVAELSDPARGLAAGNRAVLVTGSYTTEASREPWSSTWWPGGFVVLRVQGGLRDGRVLLSVLSAVGPPGATPRPTREPTPVPTGHSVEFLDDHMDRLDGKRVRWGPQITRYLATKPAGSFLVIGEVRNRECSACAGGSYPVLAEQAIAGVRDRGTRFPLLAPDGTWFRVRRSMIWTMAGADGAVVLRVHANSGACPAGADCTGALVVEEAIAPRE